MKENIKDLYFVECRHYVNDLINSVSFDDKEIVPRPDFIDYYTIVKKNDNNFTEIFCKRNKLIIEDDINSIQKYHDLDVIISLLPLSDYIKRYDFLSVKDCLLILEAFKGTFRVNDSYGYIDNSKSKCKSLG